MGVLLELQENSGQEEPLRATVHIHFYFHRVGRSSAKVLWPTCKITIPSYITVQKKKAGITRHHHTPPSR